MPEASCFDFEKHLFSPHLANYTHTHWQLRSTQSFDTLYLYIPQWNWTMLWFPPAVHACFSRCIIKISPDKHSIVTLQKITEVMLSTNQRPFLVKCAFVCEHHLKCRFLKFRRNDIWLRYFDICSPFLILKLQKDHVRSPSAVSEKPNQLKFQRFYFQVEKWNWYV